MLPTSPQDQSSIRTPHPLAERMIERLRAGSRVLDFAAGSGRNATALARAGFEVVAVDDATASSSDPLGSVAGSFDGTISTHGLLHGSSQEIAGRVRALVERLAPGGVIYATFGSSRDARFGQGTRLDEFTFASTAGDERGVPHTFFTAAKLHALLDPLVVLESLEEAAVDEIAGRWAHGAQPLAQAVHWFAVGRRA